MKKYRFKTEAEFRDSGRWRDYVEPERPMNWNGDMLRFLGTVVPDEHQKACEKGWSFDMYDDKKCRDWNFDSRDYIEDTTPKTQSGFIIHPVKEFKM